MLKAFHRAPRRLLGVVAFSVLMALPATLSAAEPEADDRLAIDDPGLATMQLKSLLKGVLFWPLVIGYGERPTKKEVNAIVKSGVRMFLDHYAGKQPI